MVRMLLLHGTRGLLGLSIYCKRCVVSNHQERKIYVDLRPLIIKSQLQGIISFLSSNKPSMEKHSVSQKLLQLNLARNTRGLCCSTEKRRSSKFVSSNGHLTFITMGQHSKNSRPPFLIVSSASRLSLLSSFGTIVTHTSISVNGTPSLSLTWRNRYSSFAG